MRGGPAVSTCEGWSCGGCAVTKLGDGCGICRCPPSLKRHAFIRYHVTTLEHLGSSLDVIALHRSPFIRADDEKGRAFRPSRQDHSPPATTLSMPETGLFGDV